MVAGAPAQKHTLTQDRVPGGNTLLCKTGLARKLGCLSVHIYNSKQKHTLHSYTKTFGVGRGSEIGDLRDSSPNPPSLSS